MAMFVFTSLLMLSLSAILYIVVRALPRIVEEPGMDQKGLLDGWARYHIPEKVDAVLNGFLFKFLRKLKVLVMKVDNALSKHLEKVKPEDNGKKPSIDFKEIAEQNKESETSRI